MNVQEKEACKRKIPNQFLQLPRQYCSHHQECQQKLPRPQVEIICAEKSQNIISHIYIISVDFHFTENACKYFGEDLEKELNSVFVSFWSTIPICFCNRYKLKHAAQGLATDPPLDSWHFSFNALCCSTMCFTCPQKG